MPKSELRERFVCPCHKLIIDSHIFAHKIRFSRLFTYVYKAYLVYLYKMRLPSPFDG